MSTMNAPMDANAINVFPAPMRDANVPVIIPVSFAALDVFDNEPTPRVDILTHPKISLTPHIGASTNEAQERIGLELANLIIGHFKK